MYEIEMKAWLLDRARAEAALNRIGTFEGIVDKDDVYWKPQSAADTGKNADIKKVRVRREVITAANGGVETAQTVVTTKNKQVRDDFEVNKESEFTVSDADAFESFLLQLGFRVAHKKHKRTHGWKCPLSFNQAESPQTADGTAKNKDHPTLVQSAHAEIAEVSAVGTFLEIEILSPTNDENAVRECRQKLNELFSLCGVAKTEIETRYYSDLLKDGITERNRNS